MKKFLGFFSLVSLVSASAFSHPAVTGAVRTNTKSRMQEDVNIPAAKKKVIVKKQNQDDPTQVPIGKPIGLVVVGSALLLLPSVINSETSSITTTPKDQE